MQNQEPTGSTQQYRPETSRIPVHSRRQAMDWSLVLVSQGIEPVIEPPGEGGSWALVIAARDTERALKSLRQYRVENRGWNWSGQFAGEQFRFEWGCIGWAIVLMLFHWLSGVVPGFMSGGVMDSVGVVSGQWWRLFTAIMLHADLGHLATNLAIGLLLLGLAMGRFGGGIALLTAYLAGAGGNVASLLLNARPFHGLGSSGMVMGALGLLVAQSFAPNQTRGKSLKYLLMGTVAGFMLFILLGLAPGTDIAAHFGGFIFGLLLGMILVRPAASLLENPKFVLASWPFLMLLVALTWTLALRHK